MDEGSSVDDAAVSDVNFRCSDGGEMTNLGLKIYAHWGTFGDWLVCPAGSGVCGIRVQVQANQGSGGERFLAQYVDNADVW